MCDNILSGYEEGIQFRRYANFKVIYNIAVQNVTFL